MVSEQWSRFSSRLAIATLFVRVLRTEEQAYRDIEDYCWKTLLKGTGRWEAMTPGEAGSHDLQSAYMCFYKGGETGTAVFFLNVP